jgi:hypothetical protein
VRVPSDYFDATMLHRQRLLWAIAARRQLDRWESILAARARVRLAGGPPEDATIWEAESEHHFALIAAHHLLTALDLPPSSHVPVDQTLRDELTEGRHLHEHWTDNMLVFNRRDRRREIIEEPPHPSGKSFNKRNPKSGPYTWLSWNNKAGPMLLPNVPASELRTLLDAVEAEALAGNADLSRFVPPPTPSAWLQHEGEWWPA